MNSGGFWTFLVACQSVRCLLFFYGVEYPDNEIIHVLVAALHSLSLVYEFNTFTYSLLEWLDGWLGSHLARHDEHLFREQAGAGPRLDPILLHREFE